MGNARPQRSGASEATALPSEQQPLIYNLVQEMHVSGFELLSLKISLKS